MIIGLPGIFHRAGGKIGTYAKIVPNNIHTFQSNTIFIYIPVFLHLVEILYPLQVRTSLQKAPRTLSWYKDMHSKTLHELRELFWVLYCETNWEYDDQYDRPVIDKNKR